jgi:hypothetical protein
MPLLLLGGPGSSLAAPIEQGERVEPVETRLLTHTVEARPRDPLVAYAWDGSGEVPAVFETALIPLDHGELAPTPDSQLHLSLNEGAGDRIRDLSGNSLAVHARNLSWVRGRYGHAVAGGGRSSNQVPTSSLEVDMPPFGTRWTLELWVRPDSSPASHAELLAAPGVIVIHLREDLRIAVDLAGRPGGPENPDGPGTRRGLDRPTLLSDGRLVPNRWNHVAVAYDQDVFHHLRLVVNGKPRVRALSDDGPIRAGSASPAASHPRGSTRIALGGWGSGGRPFAGAIDQLTIVPRATPTAELIERFEGAPTPGAHRLSLRFESGVEEVELWTWPLTEPMLGQGSTSLWLQGALDGVVADDRGIRWAPARWTRIRPPLSPAPRTTHPTVYVGHHKAFVFGGEVRDSHFPPMINTNDTWLYDMKERTWSRDASPDSPPRRCHQDFAYSADHDLVLLIGGWQNDSSEKPLLSDVWVYHVSERRWEERPPEGVRIPRMSDTGVVYHAAARRFLVFRQDEIFVYDPERDHWSLQPTPRVVNQRGKPDKISGRVSPIMGYDPESELILRFGGAKVVDGDRIYTDSTVLYDFDQNLWTIIKPEPRPAPRVRAGFAYDSKQRQFVLAGGVRDQFSIRYSDLWTFDMATRRWTELWASNAPSRRGGYYGMAYDPELEEFVLPGGRPSHAVLLDETWHLKIDPTAVGTATYVFDRAAFPEADRWFDSSVQPPGSRIELRFAASADSLKWSDWVDAPEDLAPPSPRYVKVEARLVPGLGTSQPSITAMGFQSQPAQTEGGRINSGTRLLPISAWVLSEGASASPSGL